MSLMPSGAVAIGLALVATLGIVEGSARADEPGATQPAPEAALPDATPVGGVEAVERAETSLREYVFDEALTRAERSIAAGGLSRTLLGRALKVRAESLSALNRPEDAERAYAELLSVQPDFDIDARLGPRIRSPFFEARAFLDAQGKRPGLTLSIREAHPGRVDVRVQDPLAMVVKVVVHHRKQGGGAFTSVDLPRQGGVLPLPEGSTHELYIRALTPQGSIAFELGGPNKPMTTEGSSTVMSNPPKRHEGRGPVRRPARPETGPARSEGGSVFESPVFWVIAGIVVTGAAATGIVIATQ